MSKKTEKKKKKQKNKGEDLSPPPETKKRGKKKLILLFLLLFILALAGTAFFFLKPHFMDKDEKEEDIYPALKLTYLNIEDEILYFIWEKTPESYLKLSMIDKELFLIEDEIKRIEKIALRFPEQERIVQREIREWQKLKKDIETALPRIKFDINSQYVKHLIDPERNKDLIKQEGEDIFSMLESTLRLSQEKTRFITREKEEKPDSLKETILKYLPFSSKKEPE